MATRKFTGRALALLWYATVTVVIGAAVLMSLARALLPLADDYRARVEELVSEQIGQPVRIQGMNARLLGTTPTLVFSHVELMGEHGPAARFAELRLGFDLIASLRRWQPVLDKLVLTGAHLSVERLLTGQIRVRGLAAGPSGGGAGAPQAFGLWLASQPMVVIKDSGLDWHDEHHGGYDARFKDVDIELRNSADRHRLNVMIDLPEKLGHSLRLSVDLHGDPFQPASARGTAYLHAKDWRPAPWLRDVPALAIRPDEGRVDLDVWGQWSGLALESVRGTIAGRGLALRGSGGNTAAFEQLGGRFRWTHSERQWRLDVADLRIDHAGSRWEGGRIHAEGGIGDGQLQVEANRLDIGDMAAVARLWPLPAQFRPWLQAHPRGSLSALRASVADGQIRFQTRMSGLAMEPVQQLPGFSGVDGTALYAGGRAEIDLDSRNLVLKQPGLFREPLALGRVRGPVSVRAAGPRWRVSFPAVQVSNPDLAAQVGGSILVGQSGSPYLDLKVDVARARAVSVPRYLPANIMPDSAVHWLDTAFRTGDITGGSVLIHGRTEDFPYRHNEGRFSTHLKIRNLEIAYLTGWPLVRDLTGEVAMEQGSLEVNVTDGRVLDSTLQAAVARIDDLAQPVLRLTGTVAGPLGDLARYMEIAPIAEELDSTLRRFTIGGRSRLALKLLQPLSDSAPQESYVRGQVALTNGRLGLAPGVTLEDLAGTVSFDGVRINSRHIDGSLLGEPLQLTLYSEGSREVSTHIAMRGSISAHGIRQLWRSPLTQRLAGRTAWQGRLTIPHGEGGTVLRLNSNLQGLASSLPRPLQKQLTDSLPLELSSWFSGPRRGQIQVNLGQRVALAGVLAPDLSIERMAVSFGGTPQLPKRRLLRVSGALDGLSVDAWRRVLATGAGGGEWSLPIDVAMERLWLVSGGPPKSGKSPTDGGSSEPPRDLPPITGHIGDLRYDQADLGELGFATEPAPGRLRLTAFTLKNAAFAVDATGAWDFRSKPSVTKVNLKARAHDIGKAAQMFNVASVLTKGEGNVNLQLSWPGPPQGFAAAHLNGRVQIDLDNVVLEEVNPGAGRLLGLLSLQALPRRLLLDFRDLFEKGTRFKSIKGDVKIVDGNAYTDNLQMEALPASVLITGRTGLAARDFDQLVTIVPEVAGSLPLAGYFTIGPQAGAVLLLFQQIFGHNIDKAAKFEYRITGPWDDPSIKRVGTNKK